MDKRSLVLFLSGLAAAGAVVGIAASCSDQPRIKCTAGHGAFAVKYTVVSGDPDGCGLKGETVGVEAYNYPLTDRSNLDPDRGSLAVQTATVDEALAAHHLEEAPSLPFSKGDWATSEPTPDNFCTVQPMNAVDLNLLQVDGGADGAGFVPAENIKYNWSNVRIYNTPAAPGTQLIADVEYSRAEGANPACTTKFKAVGLWPAVGCVKVTPQDGGPPLRELDPSLCSPVADLTKTPPRPTGSGIGPDIDWVCDPELELCVLKRDPPSFK